MKTRRAELVAFKFLLDSALTMLTLVLLSVVLTGVALHEWLGVVLIVLLVVHLLLSWSWITATLRRFFAPLAPLVRINAVLNLLLFVVSVVVLASGLLISVVALPFFGVHPFPTMFLRLLHLVSADVLLIVVALHLGLNWKWVAAALRKQLVAPVITRAGRLALAARAISLQIVSRAE